MKTPTCYACGREMYLKHKQTKYCSKACSAIARKRRRGGKPELVLDTGPIRKRAA